MISSNVKYRAREWSEWDERHGRFSRKVAVERGGSSRDTMEPTGVERHRLQNPRARVSEREASESTLLDREDFRSSQFRRDPRFLPHARYFAGFCLVLASARRSVFLRRALRFLTLSLPWLCPISFKTRPPVAPSQFVGGSTLHVSR
jgi:hypothetical protein